jgi:molybdopterin synthase catalytic subunit
MRVRVVYLGILKDHAGKGMELVELSDGAKVSDLWTQLTAKYPKLSAFANSAAVAVNQEYAPPATELRDGFEIALLPPVSGGSELANAQARLPLVSAHCRIQHEKIDAAATSDLLRRGQDGAVAVFEGVVRNNTRGRRTLYLDYEAYEGMAIRKLEALAQQSLLDYEIRDVAIVHRVGRLEIGETSVLIAVASAHRGAAFDACRWLIDTLKKTVPIYKKEYFEDGALWADGEPFPAEIKKIG